MPSASKVVLPLGELAMSCHESGRVVNGIESNMARGGRTCNGME